MLCGRDLDIAIINGGPYGYDTGPLVIGRCAACGGDICDDEEGAYDDGGELIHEDCWHEYSRDNYFCSTSELKREIGGGIE